jgi:tripartite-type tricarboxylate transporter receptor subunit TctC
MTMARLYAALLAIVAALAPATYAAADDYPSKPVRIIVPFAPGGLNDTVGRMIATHLTARLGKQFVVENRTGAGGVVGSEIVAHAPNDGHTLLVASIAHAVNPWLHKLPYDALKSFTPVAIFLSSANLIAVNNELPAKSVKEFVALAKAKPGQLRYASGGVGGSLHLAFELFKNLTGIDVLHVPFRGAGPGIIDVVGGHTHAISATIATLSPHVRSGKLRALGVSGTSRSPSLPEVPTVAEEGIPGYDAGNWIGLVAPAGTPEPIVSLLHKELTALQNLPDTRKKLANDGAEVVQKTPAEFGAFMEVELEKWGKVIKTAGIKAQ